MMISSMLRISLVAAGLIWGSMTAALETSRRRFAGSSRSGKRFNTNSVRPARSSES